MKIGKKSIVKKIENPFRPRFGLPRKHTICRITMDSKLLHEDEYMFSMQVDADPSEKFEGSFKSFAQNSEWFRDNSLEMWFFLPKHKDDIVELAKEHYNLVVLVDENKKVTNYKRPIA